MNEEIIEYQKYLLNFGMVKRPKMPKFDLLAYTDIEYQSAIFECFYDFEKIDEEYLTLQHLKGD